MSSNDNGKKLFISSSCCIILIIVLFVVYYVYTYTTLLNTLFPTLSPSPTSESTPTPQIVEILYAWYGIDSSNPTENIETAPTVIAKLKAVVAQYGFIAIPANMTAFYNVNPLPGVAKTTAIALKINGVQVAGDLRAPQGVDFIYPVSFKGTPAAAAALAAIKATLPAAGPGPSVDIVYAWYGTAADYNAKGQTLAKVPQVIAKLQATVAKYGFIAIPGNMAAFYGYDPVTSNSDRNGTAIALIINGIATTNTSWPGSTVPPPPFAPAGTDYIYPASYIGTPEAAAALAAIKASLPG